MRNSLKEYYLISLRDSLQRARNDLAFVETLLSELVDNNKRLCEILSGLQTRLKDAIEQVSGRVIEIGV